MIQILTMNKFQMTPLHTAAINGNLHLCRLLVENNPVKNPADNFGTTPLHWAASLGHLEICNLIIKKVRDKNPANKNGETPLHHAPLSGNFDVCKLIIEKVVDKNPKGIHIKFPKMNVVTPSKYVLMKWEYFEHILDMLKVRLCPLISLQPLS